MSTRSNIGIYNEDGSITAIYCHFDGYIKGGVGEELYRHYSNEDKVKRLIALGAISSLEDYLDDIFAYHRNRGEDFEQLHFKDIDDYLDNAASDIEYLYLWRDNDWYVFYDGINRGWYKISDFIN